MFGATGVESLDLSSFNTEKIESMVNLFRESKNLKKVNLSNFKVNSDTQIEKMFFHCPNLEKKNIITKDKRILAQYDSDLIAKEEDEEPEN